MIETVIVLLGFLCPAPDLPTDAQVSSVLATGWPSMAVHGASPYDFVTAPLDGDLIYKITVDPTYEDYALCFTEQVRSTLRDERSWGGIREGDVGETPNVWIILAPPGGSCASPELPRVSCAAGINGTGEIRINALRWFRGASGLLSLADERAHIINHEVGHMLGMAHPETCTEPDVMRPYYDLRGCGMEPWPALSPFG